MISVLVVLIAEFALFGEICLLPSALYIWCNICCLSDLGCWATDCVSFALFCLSLLIWELDRFFDCFDFSDPILSLSVGAETHDYRLPIRFLFDSTSISFFRLSSACERAELFEWFRLSLRFFRDRYLMRRKIALGESSKPRWCSYSLRSKSSLLLS